jgi:hypothetical protein
MCRIPGAIMDRCLSAPLLSDGSVTFVEARTSWAAARETFVAPRKDGARGKGLAASPVDLSDSTHEEGVREEGVNCPSHSCAS